jgi:CheY-like chemotaxis protein
LAHILLVEDDPDVRPSTERLGTFAGAMTLLSSNAYDLVIADAQLKDGNGLDVANAAKSREAKALMLTGYAAKFPLEVLEEHPCLGKPVRAEVLLRAVAQCLEVDTTR